MYRVRGADQNVYGPIAADTVRQWIAERRLNRDSQVCREGEDVWQPLGQVAEFSDALAGAGGLGMAPSGAAIPALPTGAGGAFQAPTGSAGREAIVAQTKPAAICLIVFGAVMLLLSLVNVLTTALRGGKAQLQELPPDAPEFLRQVLRFQTDMPAAVQYGLIGTSILVFSLVVLGGVRMLQMRTWGLALTAAILVMIPCFTSCCCVLGLPLGIWVVILINKPEVRSQFE